MMRHPTRLLVLMALVAGLAAISPATGSTLRDGSAMDCFRALIAAQGGDLSAPLPLGAHTETVTADRGGTIGDIDAMAVAMAAWRLGAGRTTPGEPVQAGAGVRIHRRPGEPVTAGEAVFTLYTDTPERLGPGGKFQRRLHSQADTSDCLQFLRDSASPHFGNFDGKRGV